MTQGVVLTGADPALARLAANHKCKMIVGLSGALPFNKNVVISPGARVSWQRLPLGIALLENWDALVPLGKPGQLAADLGTATERKYTQAVIRDLRIPTFAPELIFVRDSAAGQALIDQWQEETRSIDGGSDIQLAFLRAMYKVKPRLCPLPQLWMGISRERRIKVSRRRGRSTPKGIPLVRLEISPGRYVQVHKGQEAEALKQFEGRRSRRGRRAR